MNLIDLGEYLETEQQAIDFLEHKRWPDGVCCVVCGGNRISKFWTKDGQARRKNSTTGEVDVRKVPARFLYQCLEPSCRQQFSVTAGTIFKDTHLPLHKWFKGIALMCNAKKGVSAMQMQRDLGISYKAAWFLNHRIREAMIGSSPAVFEES